MGTSENLLMYHKMVTHLFKMDNRMQRILTHSDQRSTADFISSVRPEILCHEFIVSIQSHDRQLI